MYEERKNSFTLRNTILQLLLIILFIFIMIWLFPTKNYLENNTNVSNNNNALYVDYLLDMRDAGKDYFNNDKMPSKVGDTVVLTLNEMLEKKLILSIGDYACNGNDSRIEVTKMDNDFQMKVQLTCDSFNEYILLNLGCKDYCNLTCGKEEIKTTITQYQYSKLTKNSNYTDWSNWSEWKELTTTVKNTDLEQYETKVEKVATGTKKECNNVQTMSSTISKRVVDTKTPSVTTNEIKYTDAITSKKTTYGDWVEKGYVTSELPLKDSSTVKYVFDKVTTTQDCDACTLKTAYRYIKYTRSSKTTTTYSCPEGYTKNEKNECFKIYPKTVNVSCTYFGNAYVLENGKCVKYEEYSTTVPVSNNVCKSVTTYSDVTLYRVRTRKLTSSNTTSIKWSNSKNDSSLLKAGYKLTGKTRQVTK